VFHILMHTYDFVCSAQLEVLGNKNTCLFPLSQNIKFKENRIKGDRNVKRVNNSAA
jgi:hypothetical protein